MAVSSPETRFNIVEGNRRAFIKSIKIQGKEIHLSPGMNAIIGENGSGKSTLLDLMNKRPEKSHIKRIKDQNAIIVEEGSDLSQIKYVEQGAIVEKFKDPSKLFNQGSTTYFKDVDHSNFIASYRKYSEELNDAIKNNIDKCECINNLNNILLYKDIEGSCGYYIDVIENIEVFNNEHAQAYNDMRKLLITITEFKDKKYYAQYKDRFEELLKIVKEIYNDIKKSYVALYTSNEVMNIIKSCVDNYTQEIKRNSTSKDIEQKAFEQKRNMFINDIIKTVKKSLLQVKWPILPKICNGVSSNSYKGFKFNKEAFYHQKDMSKTFLMNMFTANYQELEKIKEINSYKKLQEAIRGCTDIQSIDKEWNSNVEKFISTSMKEECYILDAGDQQIGNTLGEMSLSYYRFFTRGIDDWQVLIIDQPEDNISNNKIKNELIGYFQNIRDNKQIIYVTHNPLLVVNMDVDNVIYVKNDKGILSIEGGCLEYENGVDILSIIANTMDGGKETIEKRLMFYGKEN